MASIEDRRVAVRDGKKVKTGFKGPKPWRVRWREYANGPQKTRHFAKQADAKRFVTEIEHSLYSGIYAPPEAGAITLRQYTADHFGRQHWRESTKGAAQVAIERALAVLGDRPLNSIRRGDVQAFLGGLIAVPEDAENRRALKPSTVRLTKQHLSGVLQAAVDDGLITRNPAAGVRVAAAKTPEVVPPTVAEVLEVYDKVPEWFRVGVLLGAGLGLRQAEASGLTLDRVDWTRRQVRIDRQWQTRREPHSFVPPKTSASVRTIPVGDSVLAELGRLVGRRAEGFVLQHDGEPVSYHVFANAWRAGAGQVGLGRYHTLRHYYASTLISAGCSIKAVQRALGHSSAATTLDLYSHLMPSDEDRIRSAVDLAFTAEDHLRTGTEP